MSRIYAILERLGEVNPLITLGAILAFVIAAVLIPPKYRLAAALAFAGVWINLGRFKLLGGIAALAKASFAVPLVLIWLTATMHAGPRRNAPWVSWVYVLTPVLAVFCVMLASDAAQVLAYLLCFFLGGAAALQVVRLAVSRESLNYIMIAYMVGMAVPWAICLLAFIKGGSAHYLYWGARFMPFGSPSNQTIPMLAQPFVLGLYFFHAFQRLYWKIFAIALSGSSAALILASGSRQGVLILAIVLLPYVLTTVRRPLYLAMFFLIGVGVFSWQFYSSGEAARSQVGRATDFSDTSKRDVIALRYLDVISQSPAVGLMGSSDPALAAPAVGTHAHNSYLELFYWGGVTVGLPALAAFLYSVYAGFRLVLKRKRVAIDPACIVVLYGALLAVYAHGMVGIMIYNSLTTWPFYHFLLSGLLVGLYNELKVARAAEQL